MKLSIAQYNEMDATEGLNLVQKDGQLLDEVVIFGLLRMQIFSLQNFYVQAVYNKNDNTLMDIKALISDDDWNPYLETLDIQDFY